jgi:hypothetical protein
LTANSPADHPWHHGLWFSWMQLNGVDYWSVKPDDIRSGGRTEVAAAKAVANEDYSAKIELTVTYHPQNEPPVLTEKRVLQISPPDAQGGYRIDWASEFTAGEKDVVLKGGTAGGGYAGLSVRVAQNSRDWVLSDSEGRSEKASSASMANAIHGQHARWADVSLVSSITGQPAGIALFDHPDNLRYPSYWHCVLQDKTAFGYFSPAPLWKEPYTLGAGKKLILRYGILVHAGRGEKDKLEQQWTKWSAAAK